MSDALHAAIMNLPCKLPALAKALTRLCRVFPTDGDMAEAGWAASEIRAACDAYDAARAALAAATGEQSHE